MLTTALRWQTLVAELPLPQAVAVVSQRFEKALTSGFAKTRRNSSDSFEENDVRVADFLGRHADAAQRALEWPTGIRRHGTGQLLPSNGGGEDNHDGFFYAAIEKRGG